MSKKGVKTPVSPNPCICTLYTHTQACALHLEIPTRTLATGPPSHVEVLAPSISEYDRIWKLGSLKRQLSKARSLAGPRPGGLVSLLAKAQGEGGRPHVMERAQPRASCIPDFQPPHSRGRTCSCLSLPSGALCHDSRLLGDLSQAHLIFNRVETKALD